MNILKIINLENLIIKNNVKDGFEKNFSMTKKKQKLTINMEQIFKTNILEQNKPVHNVIMKKIKQIISYLCI